MRAKVALAGLVALAAIAASVSATSVAVPFVPQRGSPVEWTPLDVQTAQFPDGVSLAATTAFAIGSQAAYNEFIASVAPAGAGERFPFVDFSSQFLIVASSGVMDLGNDLMVTSAKTDGTHIVVYLERQVDNPNHCRVTHDLHFVGQLALVQRTGSVDPQQPGTVGFVTSVTEMPYDDWYNCMCPEM